MVVRRYPFDIVEFLDECIGQEDVHTRAGAGEKLLDQRHGVRFALRVLLHEVFRLAGPRIL
jgi:hypothetical protein